MPGDPALKAIALTLILSTISPSQQCNTLFATLERNGTVPIIQGNPLPWLRIQGWPGAYFEIWACPHLPFYEQEQTLYGSVDLPMFYYDFFLAWSGYIGPSNGQTSAGQTFIGPVTTQPPPGIVLTLQGIVEDPINTPYGYLLTAALVIVTY